MKEFLHHFFIPRESNNHRPKLLHHPTLVFLIILLFLGQIGVNNLKTNTSDVLGSAIDITLERLLMLTNQKRQENGLTPLIVNNQLTQAAREKAKHMLSHNYWAHNAPDGTQPWYFIKNARYDYTYAGENLARGFSKSEDIVAAWMASSSHRENMLSSNYNDVGFAFMEGNLLGESTTLVVEMFGSRALSSFAKNDNQSPPVITQEKNFLGAALKRKPLINLNAFTTNMALLFVTMFVIVLALDAFIIERKKIARLVGHNLDHMLFLGAVLLFVFLYKGGIIL